MFVTVKRKRLLKESVICKVMRRNHYLSRCNVSEQVERVYREFVCIVYELWVLCLNKVKKVECIGTGECMAIEPARH